MRANRMRWLAWFAATIAGASACQTLLGPPPIDTNWRTYDGPRVSFHVRPGSVAEQNVSRLIEVLEDQYSSTTAALKIVYAGRVQAYAHDSATESHLLSDFSGRAYPETESFRFVCVPPITSNTFSLMSHEANHVLIVNGLGRAGTYFMNEGLASAVVSETFHTNGRHFLFPWTK